MINVRPEHNYGKALVEDFDFSHEAVSFEKKKTDIQYMIKGMSCGLEFVNITCWVCCTKWSTLSAFLPLLLLIVF